MMVYIVVKYISGLYEDDIRIICVFSSEESAKQYIESFNKVGQWYVEEWKVY